MASVTMGVCEMIHMPISLFWCPERSNGVHGLFTFEAVLTCSKLVRQPNPLAFRTSSLYLSTLSQLSALEGALQ